MNSFYLVVSYTAALISLFSFVLLFLKRKEGGKAREILCVITLGSCMVFSYHFSQFYMQEHIRFIVSPVILALAIGIFTSRVIYPIEVIIPGWLSVKRVLILFLPVVLMLSLYEILVFLDWRNATSTAILQLKAQWGDLKPVNAVIFLVSCFFPVLYLFCFYIGYKERIANIRWFKKYFATLIISSVTYIASVFNYDLFFWLHYLMFTFITFYVTYLEFYERIKVVADPDKKEILFAHKLNKFPLDESIHCTLFDKLEYYMHKEKAWRDPELSMSALVRYLGTNRTTLSRVLQEKGYDGYTAYINQYRVKDFIETIQCMQTNKYQTVFYKVGFRSRATALRNFKHITNMTPSEYFKQADVLDKKT